MSSEFVVRCSGGHLFTTKWMPLVSFKAIRLGRARFQRCPVGSHWALVRKVDPATLTDSERRDATAVHDTSVV